VWNSYIEIFSLYNTFANGISDSFANEIFLIMLRLSRSIDAFEAGFESLMD
jgi:hypothetical protein